MVVYNDNHMTEEFPNNVVPNAVTGTSGEVVPRVVSSGEIEKFSRITKVFERIAQQAGYVSVDGTILVDVEQFVDNISDTSSAH